MEGGKSTAVFFSWENKEFSSVATLTKTKRLVYFVHGFVYFVVPSYKVGRDVNPHWLHTITWMFCRHWDCWRLQCCTQCHGDTFYLCKHHYSAASLSSLCYIETLVGTSLSTHLDATVTIADEATSNSNHSSNSEYCTNIGGITLTRKHLHQIINGKELCNLHVNAFQNLLKLQFPCIGGLQNTLAETGPAEA